MSGDKFGISRRGFLQVVAQATAGGAACLLAGCLPWMNSGQTQTSKKIPPMTAPPDAMRLDIVFAERPVGDALVGDKLWQHLDQRASLTNDVREQLQHNGFRVGVAAARPHGALQTLLGLKSDFAYEPSGEKAKHMVGRQVMIRSDGETQIEASPVCSECTVEINNGRKSLARTYLQCRGTFKLVAHRLEDGWAQLEFVPIVLHGAEGTQYVPGSEGWQMANGQRSEVFHDQRFQLNLGVGEMVVVSADETAENSLGHLFFVGKSHLHKTPNFDLENTPVQRVLVVRLAEMPRTENLYGKVG